MDISFQLPTTIYGWIAIIAAIIAGFVLIRRNDIKAITENADQLRKILEDKVKQINDMQTQINHLQVEIDGLKKTNKTLEDLVLTALKQYFFENPKIATSLQEKILK